MRDEEKKKYGLSFTWQSIVGIGFVALLSRYELLGDVLFAASVIGLAFFGFRVEEK